MTYSCIPGYLYALTILDDCKGIEDEDYNIESSDNSISKFPTHTKKKTNQK